MRTVITDPIFRVSITLFVCPAEEYNAYVQKKYPFHRKGNYAVSDDAALYDGIKRNGEILARHMWFPKWSSTDTNPGLLIHETSHAIHEIAKWLGFKWTKSSEEFYAYYHEWWYEAILKKLLKGEKK